MATDYRELARQKAAKYGLIPEVFERQIQAESGFSPDVISGQRKSSAGALGIAQIMPSTAASWGVNPLDPVAALDAAAKNMAAYVKTFGGVGTTDPVKVRTAYEKALQAYNAGPGSVGKYLPAATKSYISKIVGPDKFSFTEAVQRGVGATVSSPDTAPAPTPVEPIKLPRFDFKGALTDIVSSFAQKVNAPSESSNAFKYLELANALDQSGNPESSALAEAYRAKALEASMQPISKNRPEPTDLLGQILQAKVKESQHNAEAAALEQQINKSIGATQAATTAPTQLTPGKGLALKGVTITSPVDTSGEPGFDFVIPGGRGATFTTPFKAQVLKVVNDPWETNLEKGPGRRGYGNYVDIRGVDPITGRQFDVRLAHFDKLNPALKPGAVIEAGTPIGTQGRSGSTTGAHVSADFYDPGKNTASADILKLRDRIRDRLAKGLPVFE